ncbi:MAG: hypothetical protein [Arizlama microvirus]|nr:MAG: hypothetical protein [Arizlama microvirus]
MSSVMNELTEICQVLDEITKINRCTVREIITALKAPVVRREINIQIDFNRDEKCK